MWLAGALGFAPMAGEHSSHGRGDAADLPSSAPWEGAGRRSHGRKSGRYRQQGAIRGTVFAVAMAGRASAAFFTRCGGFHQQFPEASRR